MQKIKIEIKTIVIANIPINIYPLRVQFCRLVYNTFHFLPQVQYWSGHYINKTYLLWKLDLPKYGNRLTLHLSFDFFADSLLNPFLNLRAFK